MSGWFWVLFWWVAFAGAHLVLSSVPVRRPIVQRLGDRGFQGVYSLAALGTFIMLVRTYWSNKHRGPLLWSLASIPGVRWLSITLSGLAVIVLVMSFMQPSPTSMSAGAPDRARARGLTRITRHPLFTAFGLWGFSHALVNSYLTDVIFFGGFLVFVLLGATHQDARKLATAPPALRSFYAETSLIPFGSVLAGRNRVAVGEIPWVGAVIGLVVAIVLYTFHRQLFG